MTNINNIEEVFREEYCKFRQKHGKKYIYKEVPVFSRSVDLVEYDTHTNKITAIEFKIYDWKRAINQLVDVSSCFDYLVLCFPKPKTKNCLINIKTQCSNMGIGLITWDASNNSFISECKPRSIEIIWKAQKSSIIKYLKDRRNNDER